MVYVLYVTYLPLTLCKLEACGRVCRCVCVCVQVEVKAVPIVKDCGTDERRAKRLSRYDENNSLLYGGHPPPKLDQPYQVTVRDTKDAYHAICMMKVLKQ